MSIYQDTTAILEREALVADLRIGREYDWQRGGRPYDMTRSRRERALRRLEEQVRNVEREHGPVEPTNAALRIALERLVMRMIPATPHARGGRAVSSSVVDSLEAVASALELEKPQRLVDAVAYESGGSRPATRRRRVVERMRRI